MDAEIETVVCNLARQYGAERVYLPGSYAHGDATEASDIDLRVEKGELDVRDHNDKMAQVGAIQATDVREVLSNRSHILGVEVDAENVLMLAVHSANPITI